MVMGAKVFTATKAKDREELGEVVTRWIRGQSARAHSGQDRHSKLGQRVSLPDDHDFLRARSAVTWPRGRSSRAVPGGDAGDAPMRIGFLLKRGKPEARQLAADLGRPARQARLPPGRAAGRRRRDPRRPRRDRGRAGRIDRRAGCAGRRRHVPVRRGAGRRPRRPDLRREPGQPGLHHALRPERGRQRDRGRRRRPRADRGADPAGGDDPPARAGPRRPRRRAARSTTRC